MTAVVVYTLCAVTSALCLILLLREYFRRKVGFTLWIALCFFGLFASNVVLFMDRFLVPDVSLAVFRVLPAVLGFGALIFGLSRGED